MNKKGFTLIELLAVITILALIAMVVFPAVNSSIKDSKEKAYKQQIKVIEDAAKEYALDNTGDLPPMIDGSESKIPVSVLLDGGYITDDEVKNPTNGEDITGRVTIKYKNNQYTYTYEDDDGELITNWLLENAIDKSTLKANNGIYKGDAANNNIVINGRKFKILKLNTDGTLKLVMTESIASMPFDTSGNSDFKSSSIYNYLNTTFIKSLDTSKITNFAVCTGDIDNPCKEKVSTSVGLLSIEDYVNASNKKDCSSKNNLCGEGTYLKGLNNVCLTNKQNKQIYVVNNGNITLKNANEPCNIMPVITLRSDILLKGTGTSENPFVN